jgi:MFS family permease
VTGRVLGWRLVQRTYLLLTLLTTLAASLIWGINTLFLLDAGLSNTQAFTANAFFTAGLVVSEIPTGVVADTTGRRRSFLLGTATLLVSTLLYLWMWQTQGPFWGWAVASAVIGLGFAFFSGAVEAWLVDALGACGYEGDLESVFAKGQIVQGIGMLTGSVAGGFIAQLTNLGVPYIVRAVMLGVTMAVAFALMRDQGFKPVKSKHPVTEVKRVLRESLQGGFGKPPVRWLMLEAPFTMGVGIFAFCAMQPYLLQLYGDPSAFGIAGLAAAVVAGAQIVGGMVVPLVRRMVRRRTDALLAAAIVSVASLVLMGLTDSFIVALALLVVWALTDAARMPMRQAFLNGLIPSSQRATVLSFDSLMGSAGGVVAQPVLGRVADVGGYAASYVVSGAITALCIPFIALARRERAASDPITPAAPVPDVDLPQVPPESGTLPGG